MNVPFHLFNVILEVRGAVSDDLTWWEKLAALVSTPQCPEAEFWGPATKYTLQQKYNHPTSERGEP